MDPHCTSARYSEQQPLTLEPSRLCLSLHGRTPDRREQLKSIGKLPKSHQLIGDFQQITTCQTCAIGRAGLATMHLSGNVFMKVGSVGRPDLCQVPSVSNRLSICNRERPPSRKLILRELWLVVKCQMMRRRGH